MLQRASLARVVLMAAMAAGCDRRYGLADFPLSATTTQTQLTAAAGPPTRYGGTGGNFPYAVYDLRDGSRLHLRFAGHGGGALASAVPVSGDGR